MEMDEEKTGSAQNAVIVSLIGVGALVIIVVAVFFSLKKETPAPPLARVTPTATPSSPQTPEETPQQSISAPEGTPVPVSQEIIESLSVPTPVPAARGARAPAAPTPVPQSILDSLSAPLP